MIPTASQLETNWPLDKVTITTRKSILAQWQANEVARRIKAIAPDIRVELLGLSTEGDRRQDVALNTLGGKGVFVKELETVLLANEADIAVHSMKDVPAVLPDGLEIVAMIPRANPLDALVSNHFESLEALPTDAKIGTSSLRRAVQLRRAFPEFRCEPLRGNVDTRLARLDRGDFDAIILACAGLDRLALGHRIRQRIPEDICLPSAGQGAVGIEMKTDRHDLRALLGQLNDTETSQAVNAERAIISVLGATCNQPVAVHCASAEGEHLVLRGFVSDVNGRHCLSARAEGPRGAIDDLVHEVGQSLLADGALELLAQ